MKIVCNKKTYYWEAITINIIKRISLFIIGIFTLYACSPAVYSSNVDIKVIKTGFLEFNSSYIFIMPNELNSSYDLAYKSILVTISQKLQSLGFTLTNYPQAAKYAMVVKINNYPNININNFNGKTADLISTTESISLLKQPRKFNLDVYLLNKDKISAKVLESEVEEVKHSSTNSLNKEKSILSFITCSIDALFNINVINQPSCIDYYYKCWP